METSFDRRTAKEYSIPCGMWNRKGVIILIETHLDYGTVLELRDSILQGNSWFEYAVRSTSTIPFYGKMTQRIKLIMIKNYLTDRIEFGGDMITSMLLIDMRTISHLLYQINKVKSAAQSRCSLTKLLQVNHIGISWFVC